MPETTTPWLDNYPPGVPEHVELPKASLAGLLEDAARDFPHAPALHFEGRTISYAQLNQQARRFSGALAGLGVGRGTRVGLILPNCPQAVVALFGALRLGATVVQNNPLYTERELGHQLADAGVEVLVCLDLIYDRVKALRPRTSIREVIVTSVLDELPGLKRVLAPYTKKGKAASASVGKDEPVRRWRDVLSSAPAAPELAEVDADRDLALLQYTGGTTGVSKGVMLTHANLRANVEQVRAWFPDADPGREVMMAVLPFFHVYGLTVCLLLGLRLGGGHGAAAPLRPRRRAERGRQVPADPVPGRAHHVRGHQQRGRRRAGTTCPASRPACPGRPPLPLEVAERFERFSGGRLVEGYGLSETSPVAIANPIYGKRKTGTIGMPHPRHPGPDRRPGRPLQDHAGGRAGRAGPGRAAGDAGLLEPARRDRPGPARTAGCSPGTWR